MFGVVSVAKNLVVVEKYGPWRDEGGMMRSPDQCLVINTIVEDWILLMIF